MPKYIQQEIEERYQKLPDILKDAMFSADIAAKIFAIGKKHGLTIDKIGFMAEETGYIILGLTRPSEFTQHLAERLEIDAEKARSIAIDISQQVLFPLREALKTTHQIEVNEETIQKNFIILKKPALPQVATTPAPQSSLPPLIIKPLEEKPPIFIPTPTPKPPVEKTAPLLLSPLSIPKTEPIDLRFQQKTKLPVLPPKPESMGGSIFGAPSIVNLAPKPPLPPQPPAEKPPTPKSTPGYDSYREPIE